MARKASITHIQTGAERAAGDAGAPHSETLADHNDLVNAASRRAAADRQQAAARRAAAQRKYAETERRLDEEAAARGDKTFGPGAPDGMSRRRFWQR